MVMLAFKGRGLGNLEEVIVPYLTRYSDMQEYATNTSGDIDNGWAVRIGMDVEERFLASTLGLPQPTSVKSRPKTNILLWLPTASKNLVCRVHLIKNAFSSSHPQLWQGDKFVPGRS